MNNTYIAPEELIMHHEDILKDIKKISKKISKKIEKIESENLNGYMVTPTLKYINKKLHTGNGDSLRGILEGLIKGMKNE